MKNSLIISFVFHIITLGAMVLGASFSNPWQKRFPVYQVELIEAVPRRQIVKTKPTKKRTTKEPVKKSKIRPVSIKKKTNKTAEKKEPAAQKEEEKTPEQSEQQPGAKSGEVKIASENFPFAYYLNLIRYRVQENWEPPYQATARREKISSVVGFRVLRNGKIEAVNVEISSGKFLFDQAGQRAVLTAGPLPPLPQEFREDFLTVHIEFEALW